MFAIVSAMFFSIAAIAKKLLLIKECLKNQYFVTKGGTEPSAGKEDSATGITRVCLTTWKRILLVCGSFALRVWNLDFWVVNDNANYTKRICNR